MNGDALMLKNQKISTTRELKSTTIFKTVSLLFEVCVQNFCVTKCIDLSNRVAYDAI